MRIESKFEDFIQRGGTASSTLPLNFATTLARKFAVEPTDLMGSILGNALGEALGTINAELPEGISINLRTADLSDIRDAIAAEAANRLTQIGVAVDENDPVLTEIIRRYAAEISRLLKNSAVDAV